MSSILITGGTGSFGQAFVKRLLESSSFDRIVIYSRDEHKQEMMQRRFDNDRLRFFLGDIRDKDRLRLAVADCIYIVHAAALKVVPAGEYNPMEFIKTNILGAQNLVDVLVGDRSRNYGKVIALSTDKAVNPVNLYGATKLCMEKLLIASNNLVGERNTKFSIVRYGNVANSNGSVIRVFKRAMDLGEPLPITNWEMSRFWIELEDAVDFVLEKLKEMQGGEVFIPEMPSFMVRDLARAFNQGDKEFRHKIIGIRPGEKLHEQIDENRFSDQNDYWLSWADLNDKLDKMGMLR